MFKGSSFIILLSIGITALANPISIECPNPKALQFEKLHNAPAWNEYLAKGQVQVISGEYHSFDVSGYTDAKSANILEWVSLSRDNGYNDLICNYQGLDDKDNPSMLVLADSEIQPVLRDCHFKMGDPYECNAYEMKCELICK